MRDEESTESACLRLYFSFGCAVNVSCWKKKVNILCASILPECFAHMCAIFIAIKKMNDCVVQRMSKRC